MLRLENKTAIITGASSGIGKATAERFAREGANLVLVARRQNILQDVADILEPHGIRTICVPADVSLEEDCERVVEQAVKTFGGIDILVNNAGMADKHRPITNCEAEWYHRICQVNQDSVFYMMHAVIPYMEKTGQGAIVNVASIGGISPTSGFAYTATKTAVIGMTKSVALQFSPTGIRCNAVCPGPTPTPLNTPDRLSEFDPYTEQCALHLNLTLPEAQVEDQANAILFLSSDEARAITGQALVVDHGTIL